MPVYSTNLRNRIGDAWLNGTGYSFLDSALLQCRSGAAPGPGAAATGTLLCEITLPADAVAAFAAGVGAKSGTWSGVGVGGGGTIGHVRIIRSGDANGADDTQPRMELTVGVGTGEVQFDNLVVADDQAVTINTFNVTQPASN